MSLISLPILRGHGLHRSASPSELRDENRRLLKIVAGSDDAFARLRQDRRAALDAADRLRVRAVTAENEVASMRAELLALRAFKANVNAVTIPAGERDIDPGDQPTQPVPILRRFVAGRVVTLPHKRT
ncbi:hypothetical protein EAO71_27340 [Streptomyces sp. ms191]|uniref:hypothetical protein n=1 Tax=Streptomyces sp. ms191 TaxID=1827978 RepID=UPI0011CDFFB4|nr:hypothetical protein [Streptomyces sp. ms191]TXS21417.1 hypothetical protein EAO71_27340 [Streptomyces sp. ms191]